MEPPSCPPQRTSRLSSLYGGWLQECRPEVGDKGHLGPGHQAVTLSHHVYVYVTTDEAGIIHLCAEGCAPPSFHKVYYWKPEVPFPASPKTEGGLRALRQENPLRSFPCLDWGGVWRNTLFSLK